MEKVLTLHQATKLLNVCPETLRRWEKDGELRPFAHLAVIGVLKSWRKSSKRGDYQ
jgi:predicted site-specific integrase-resolvase